MACIKGFDSINLGMGAAVFAVIAGGILTITGVSLLGAQWSTLTKVLIVSGVSIFTLGVGSGTAISFRLIQLEDRDKASIKKTSKKFQEQYRL